MENGHQCCGCTWDKYLLRYRIDGSVKLYVIDWTSWINEWWMQRFDGELENGWWFAHKLKMALKDCVRIDQTQLQDSVVDWEFETQYERRKIVKCVYSWFRRRKTKHEKIKGSSRINEPVELWGSLICVCVLCGRVFFRVMRPWLTTRELLESTYRKLWYSYFS